MLFIHRFWIKLEHVLKLELILDQMYLVETCKETPGKQLLGLYFLSNFYLDNFISESEKCTDLKSFWRDFLVHPKNRTQESVAI